MGNTPSKVHRYPAFREAGAEALVKRLPQGYESVLGKQFPPTETYRSFEN